NTNLDTTAGLGGIQIAEFEKQGASGLNDLLCRRISRLIHAALIAREPNHTRDPRTASGNLGSPHDLVRVAAVRRGPNVRNIKWTANPAFAEIILKQPVHQVIVSRKILQPENGVSMSLQLSFDLVPYASVHVVGPRKHENAGLPVASTPGQDIPALVACPLGETVERGKARVHSALGFF